MLRMIRLMWHTLTPVEVAILDSVTPLLSPKTGAIYRQQVSAINRVQRPLQWTEINFYRMVRRKPDWTGIAQFPRHDEFTLAASTYRFGNNKFKSRIICVAGHVFSLLTRPSIKKRCFGTPQQIQTQIITDPFESSTDPESRMQLPKSFLSWREEECRDTNQWCVLQPHETYVVSMPESDYVVLATRCGEQFLMAALGDTTTDRFYYSTDGSVVTLSGPFHDVLERTVKGILPLK